MSADDGHPIADDAEGGVAVDDDAGAVERAVSNNVPPGGGDYSAAVEPSDGGSDDEAAADGRSRFRPIARPASQWSAWWILGLASLVVLLPARGYLTPYTPLGDDASSHITTIATLARALATGGGWWSNDYNGGFPMVLYYQPLPHLVSASICALFGGGGAANGTYKLLMVFMLAVQPWAVYAGMRRAGFGTMESALAGLCTPLVIDGIKFGYHARASLTVGLYTQAWGNVALPLAFGELAAIARGNGRIVRAVLACAFVATTHMFFAIALVVPALIFAVGGLAWRRSAWQLPVVGAATFALLSPWLVPLANNQAFFGGWPFGRPSRVNGYGWEEVWTNAISGHLMDGDGTPMLSLLAALGLVVAVGGIFAARTRARRSAAFFALVIVAWAFVGTVGRAGIGDTIDLLNPLHRNVQLFRYGSLLQFSLVVAAGVGLGAIVRITDRLGGSILSSAALTAVMFLPVRAGVEQLQLGFRTIDKSSSFHPEDYEQVAAWLSVEEPGGRMYIGKRGGLRGHYHSGLMAWAAERPGAQSYGVGLHDSLHFYTLEYLHPNERGALALADLFDFRIVVHSRDANLSGFGELDQVYDGPRYRVSRLDVSGDAVEVMRESDTISGTPRGVRREIRAWLNGSGPANRQTVVLEVDDPRSREFLTGHPGAPNRAWHFERAPRIGETLESEQVDGTFRARVRLDEPGLIVAKIGYHPFWRVHVDGEPVETVFAFPGFLAVRANPGEHTIHGEFRWPTYSRVLLPLGPIALVLGFWVDRRLRRFGDTGSERADSPPPSAA